MKDELAGAPANGLRIILASASPRRRELIALLGLPFEVIPSRYEEPAAPNTPLSLPDFVTELAANKAREVAKRVSGELAGGAIVLAADTLVTADDADIGIPLGKPADAQDACRMLRLLAGRTHRVYTGIALITNDSAANSLSPVLTSSVVCTRVRFRELSDRMIAQYVATGEPMDKAGAYGAQGYAAPFIEGFQGDFFNVVGLPLCEVGRVLESLYPAWWQRRNNLNTLPNA